MTTRRPARRRDAETAVSVMDAIAAHALALVIGALAAASLFLLATAWHPARAGGGCTAATFLTAGACPAAAPAR